MPYINLNITQEQLSKATHIARQLRVNRSAYLREAIDHYIGKTERELLAEQFKKASEKCREESLRVCHEFENIDEIAE